MSAVPSSSSPIDDPRVYLAAERTFLAWIRTSVSLMGFGFLIARFALFIREYGLGDGPRGSRPAGDFELARVRHGVCRRVRLLSWPPCATARISRPSSTASATLLVNVRTSLDRGSRPGDGRSGDCDPYHHALKTRQPCSSA